LGISDEVATHRLVAAWLLCDAALWSSQVEGLRDNADNSVADLTQDDGIAAMARRAVAVGAQDVLTPPAEAHVIRDGIAGPRYHVFSG
jgi:hypothetical protein